jgi:hypothetical protein
VEASSAFETWRARRDAYQAALRGGSDEEVLEEQRQALFEAELGVAAALSPALERFRACAAELTGLVEVLADGLDGLIEVQQHAAAEAELTSRHGEGAGPGFTEREKIDAYELTRDELRALPDAFQEILAGLDEV